MRAYEQGLAHGHGPHPGVRLAHSLDDQLAAVDLLDRAEAAAGGPLVDEQERARLDNVAHHDSDPADHWHALLAWPEDAEAPTGYAGLVIPPDTAASGDIVPGIDADAGTVTSLLHTTRDLAADHGRGSVVMWVRHAEDRVLEVAHSAHWHVNRRLLVLGSDLRTAARPHRALPSGVELRPHTSDLDDAVVRLLRAAYAGTADGDWDVAEFRRRTSLPWFRSKDLLVAVRHHGHDPSSGHDDAAEHDVQVVGIHWTKRRDASTGEVYNLAVHPGAQGLGLGAALLDAGLDHLAEEGASRVVLWVDAANEPGLALYASRGFTQLWQDVALRADTAPHTGPHTEPHSHDEPSS